MAPTGRMPVVAVAMILVATGCVLGAPSVDDLPTIPNARPTEWHPGATHLPGGAHVGGLTASSAEALADAILSSFGGARDAVIGAQFETLSADSADFTVRSRGATASIEATDRRFALRRGRTGWAIAFAEIRHYCLGEPLADGTCA